MLQLPDCLPGIPPTASVPPVLQRTKDLLTEEAILWINYLVQIVLSLGLSLLLEPAEWHRVGDLRCAAGLPLRSR